MILFYPAKIFRSLVLFFLSIYSHYLSYFLPSSCRFYPSCSQYAREAVISHGAAGGLCLAIRRLLRCHPWSEGGFDPIPEIKSLPKQHHTPKPCCPKHALPQPINIIEN